MEKVIVLLSGGLDSVTLAHYLVKNKDKALIGMFFDYGQPFVEKELESVSNCLHDLLCEGYDVDLEAVKIPDMYIAEDSYTAQRNTIFIAYAAQYAELHDIKEIYIGLVDSSEFGVQYPDCQPGYVTGFNFVLFDYGIKLKAPFIKFDKHKVYSAAYQLGVNLENIWSCNFPKIAESGEMIRCGECKNCQKMDEYVYSNYVIVDDNPLDELERNSHFLFISAILLIFMLIVFFVR